MKAVSLMVFVLVFGSAIMGSALLEPLTAIGLVAVRRIAPLTGLNAITLPIEPHRSSFQEPMTLKDRWRALLSTQKIGLTALNRRLETRKRLEPSVRRPGNCPLTRDRFFKNKLIMKRWAAGLLWIHFLPAAFALVGAFSRALSLWPFSLRSFPAIVSGVWLSGHTVR